jgi:hypothetical protein
MKTNGKKEERIKRRVGFISKLKEASAKKKDAIALKSKKFDLSTIARTLPDIQADAPPVETTATVKKNKGNARRNAAVKKAVSQTARRRSNLLEMKRLQTVAAHEGLDVFSHSIIGSRMIRLEH